MTHREQTRRDAVRAEAKAEDWKWVAGHAAARYADAVESLGAAARLIEIGKSLRYAVIDLNGTAIAWDAALARYEQSLGKP